MKHEIRSNMTEQPTLANDGNTIEGYAAVYNSFSEDLGGFREIIRPGAFDRCLASNPDIRALIDHDSSAIIGRTRAGTAKVWSDSRGLKYQITLPDTQAARDLKVSMKRKDIDGSSFAFSPAPKGDLFRKEDGKVIRELHDVDLFDVSVVTYPAYHASEASLRGLKDLTDAEKAAAEKVAADAKAAEQAEKDKLESMRRRQRQVESEIQ